MNAQAVQPVEAIRVPIGAWFVAALSALLLYVVFQENGALLEGNFQVVHEFFHDGRHAFGVPCH